MYSNINQSKKSETKNLLTFLKVVHIIPKYEED